MIHAARTRVEKELQEKNPRLHQMLVKFAGTVAEEQERAKVTLEQVRAQVRDTSVASVLRLRRLQAKRQMRRATINASANGGGLPAHTHSGNVKRYDSSGDAGLFIDGGTDDARAPLRAETLMKQAHKDLAVWKSRFFVLLPDGLFYYDDEETFKQGKPSRGRVLFSDLQCVSGQAADLAPRFMFLLLGRQHVFVIHKEDSTYVMAASSKDSLKAWIAAINAAYDAYVATQARRAAVLETAWLAGSNDVWGIVERLQSNKANLDQALSEIVLLMDNTFEDEVLALRENYVLRRAFTVWQVWARAVHMRKISSQASGPTWM